MKSIIYPLAMPANLLDELRKASKEAALSTANTNRQRAKLRLPKLLEQMGSSRVTNVAPLPNKVARALYSQPDDDADAIRVFMATQAKSARE
jgi:hypothetical protein